MNNFEDATEVIGKATGFRPEAYTVTITAKCGCIARRIEKAVDGRSIFHTLQLCNEHGGEY